MQRWAGIWLSLALSGCAASAFDPVGTLGSTGNVSVESITAACTTFYAHASQGGSCATCTSNAPSSCNRSGIDAACSSTNSCATSSCSGAQCLCSDFATCMMQASTTCGAALQAYYECSNSNCASSCQ